jgi:hypothetical protein
MLASRALRKVPMAAKMAAMPGPRPQPLARRTARPQPLARRTALALVAENSVNRTYSPNGCGFQKPPTLKPKQHDAPPPAMVALPQRRALRSEEAGKCRAAARSAPAPLPFTRHAGLQMVVSVAKCPLYSAGASGPTATQAGWLKQNTEVHVLEEKAEGSRTWLRCRQGWLPLADESGARLLKVLQQQGALATPTGRQVVDEREGCVQAVMETLHMDRDSEPSTAWSTTSVARDELVLTFLTKGSLGFDLDLTCGRVVAISADAVAPVSTELQVGMIVRAVQGTAIADLSSAEVRRLWSSTAHRRPLALSFTLSSARTAASGPVAPSSSSSSSSRSSSSSSSSSSDSGGGGGGCGASVLRRIAGKITTVDAASTTMLCARAAEAATRTDISNPKLDSKRWAQISSSLAELGWITWSAASRLGARGGNNLVGERVAVLGQGFGTVQSYEAARRFGASAVHHVSFENQSSVQPVRLEKKGLQWLLYQPPEPQQAGEGQPAVGEPAAPPPTPISAKISLSLVPAATAEDESAAPPSPSLSLSPVAPPPVLQIQELTPIVATAPQACAQTPSSTIKVVLD